MQKDWLSLGLMSGTSGDGVDASIIRSNGVDQYELIKDKYYEYDSGIYKDIHNLKEKIHSSEHLIKFKKELHNLERKITIFHAQVIKDLNISQDTIVGFHGQTIYHNPKEKISKQLGNGNLLNQLTNKNVVYDFRKNDILNGGEGAPLTPIFHHLISLKYKINLPVCFLNIGGISNITKIIKDDENLEENIEAFDSGPGNCMIDEWVRKNSKNNFDANGSIAKSGKIDQLILNQVIDNFKIDSFEKSLDIKDFDVSFARGLSLEDGCATITNFTAYLIARGIEFANSSNNKPIKYLVCGGGRKNDFLIQSIKDYLSHKKNISLSSIDDYSLNGDYIESQAFGYLAIRSFLNLPISFPKTTGCEVPTVGGKLVENF